MSENAFNACKPCYGCRINDRTGDVYVDNYAISRDEVWNTLISVRDKGVRNYKKAYRGDRLQAGKFFIVGLIASLKRELAKHPENEVILRALLTVLIMGTTRCDSYYAGMVDPFYDVHKLFEL